MAFDLDYFDKLSAEGNPDVVKLFSYYSSADALSTIKASAYFNNVDHYLSIGDQIYLHGSDGYDVVRVTAVSPNVTVAANPDADLSSGQILVGNASNIAVGVTMSGDATLSNAGALTIANDAVTTAKILAANVTLAKLASGIAPSHVVKYAGNFTTVGGSATEAFTVTGAATTDFAFVVLKTAGATPRTVLTSTVSGANTLTVVFSGDPSNDHVITYQILRAAA